MPGKFPALQYACMLSAYSTYEHTHILYLCFEFMREGSIVVEGDKLEEQIPLLLNAVLL